MVFKAMRLDEFIKSMTTEDRKRDRDIEVSREKSISKDQALRNQSLQFERWKEMNKGKYCKSQG